MKLKTRDITQISLFVALMVIGAFIKIPNPFFPTVPITLQLFFCILGGLLLGSKKGLISMIVYLALGLVGLPVFALGGGIAYVFKPTFGFIASFIPAAFLSGIIKEKLIGKNQMLTILLASFVALLAVYVFGIAYMFLVMKNILMCEITIRGIIISMIPFIIKDILLVLTNAITVPSILEVLSTNRLNNEA